LWSWGGKEVEADGKTVVLNTKETVESVKFAVALWKETMDEGGLSWDDTSNNRAFLSGSISATNNGASIYREARKKPDSYVTEKDTPMKDNILHAPIPAGAGGQFNLPGPQTHLLMKYSKNQDATKKFLRWAGSKDIFAKWFTSQQGDTCGATKMWEDDPVWNVDPVLLPFRKLPLTGRLVGYAGKPNQKAAEVNQVHHRRHVCEGDPGHGRCRIGEGGARRIDFDLRRLSTSRAARGRGTGKHQLGDRPCGSSIWVVWLLRKSPSRTAWHHQAIMRTGVAPRRISASC
jgi:hypothetical protein